MARYAEGKLVSKWPQLLGLLIVLVLAAACGETAAKGPRLGTPTITSVTAECNDDALVRLITFTPANGAKGYRLMSGGEQLAEADATARTFSHNTPVEPDETISYVVRAVNGTPTQDSKPFEFTAPAEACNEHGGNPEDPEDPSDPEEPGDPTEPTDPDNPDDPTDPENPEDPTDPEEPEEPTDPEDPEDPHVDPPGPFAYMHVHLACEPFGEVHLRWGGVPRATSYALLQGNTVIYEHGELLTDEGQMVVDAAPGEPFQFTLRFSNRAGSITGPVAVPNFYSCFPEGPPLAAGRQSTIMIDSAGNTWGWGNNESNVLGPINEAWRTPLITTNGPKVPVRKVLFRNSVVVALTEQGQVQVWGSSADGRLGQAGVTSIAEATTVPGLSNVLDVAMGESHVLARDTSGRVWLWGTFLGQLIEEPELVPLAAGATGIAAGNGSSYVLRTDGTVMAWGSNGTSDALGLGDATAFPVPTLVPGITGAVELFAGYTSMFFRRADGSVASLGRSGLGPLTPGVSNWPELHGVKAVTFGDQFMLALTTYDDVLGWGNNDSGQLGRPVVYEGDLAPDVVQGLPPIAAVHAGHKFSVAIDHTGQVHTWGSNHAHELGLDSVWSFTTFTPVPIPEEVIAVEGGDRFVLALGRSGQVYSWGSNEYGELGRVPLLAGDWVPAPIAELTNIVQIAAGERFGMALDTASRVHTWGYGVDGALGIGGDPINFRTTPTRIGSLFSIVKIAAGAHHAVALDSSGRIFTWGAGAKGALGHGDEENRYAPAQVNLPDITVTDIAAGHSFTLLVGNGFLLIGFGANDNFQLGDEAAVSSLASAPEETGVGLAA